MKKPLKTMLAWSSSSCLAFWFPLTCLDFPCLHSSSAAPGFPVPSDVGGMEACASLPFAVAQTSIVGLYLCDRPCQGEPAEDIHNHLLPSLFTFPLSSCHVCLQTSKLKNCQCRHSWGLITMTNIASWLLYAPLSTTICCCFAYQSITVNQGISSSLLHPTPISASFS